LWSYGPLTILISYRKSSFGKVVFRPDQTCFTSLWLASTRISDHWIEEDCKLASQLILQTLLFLAVFCRYMDMIYEDKSQTIGELFSKS
jgi:hypothetical protein